MATKAKADNGGEKTHLEAAAEKLKVDEENLQSGSLSSLFSDNRGMGSFMNKGVDMAVGLLVVGLLTAYLLPIAIDEIVGVDTTAWGTAEAQLFDLLPIFFVLGVLLFVVAKATSAKRGR